MRYFKVKTPHREIFRILRTNAIDVGFTNPLETQLDVCKNVNRCSYALAFDCKQNLMFDILYEGYFHTWSPYATIELDEALQILANIKAKQTVAKRKKPTFAVDLDGVLARYHSDGGWQGPDHFGEPIPGAVEFTRKLQENGAVVIHSSRCNAKLNDGYKLSYIVEKIKDWLDKYDFAYDEIYRGEGKVVAQFYIDDKAIRCCPEQHPEQEEEYFKFIFNTMEGLV